MDSYSQAMTLGIFGIPTFFLGLIVLVIIVIQIVFFFKMWFACSDIKLLRAMIDDMHFRECARYESEKRRGLITNEDLDKAEALLGK